MSRIEPRNTGVGEYLTELTNSLCLRPVEIAKDCLPTLLRATSIPDYFEGRHQRVAENPLAALSLPLRCEVLQCNVVCLIFALGLITWTDGVQWVVVRVPIPPPSVRVRRLVLRFDTAVFTDLSSGVQPQRSPPTVCLSTCPPFPYSQPDNNVGSHKTKAMPNRKKECPTKVGLPLSFWGHNDPIKLHWFSYSQEQRCISTHSVLKWLVQTK